MALGHSISFLANVTWLVYPPGLMLTRMHTLDHLCGTQKPARCCAQSFQTTVLGAACATALPRHTGFHET